MPNSALGELSSDKPKKEIKKDPAIWEEEEWQPQDHENEGPATGRRGVRCALFKCEDVVESLGLCGKHYQFWRRNGTEALNRKVKRIPETREEARALLYVRAIELADAADDNVSLRYKDACLLIEEASRLFGDPNYRIKYTKKRNAIRASKNRKGGTWTFKGGKTHKDKYILEHGLEAWKAYKREVWERWRDRFIAKNGEQAWRDRQTEASTRYYHRQQEKKKAGR
jgi:hypothetical protein